MGEISFWYRPTRVVPDQRPLNGRCCCNMLPSLLWHCWLDVRKSIRPTKIEWWGVGVVICLERGADCLHMVQLMPLHPKAHHLGWLHPLPKSKLVLPFRCRLTQVVLEKRRLNGCSVVVVTSSTTVHLHLFTPPRPVAHAYLKLSARLLVEVLFGTGTQLWVSTSLTTFYLYLWHGQLL